MGGCCGPPAVTQITHVDVVLKFGGCSLGLCWRRSGFVKARIDGVAGFGYWDSALLLVVEENAMANAFWVSVRNNIWKRWNITENDASKNQSSADSAIKSDGLIENKSGRGRKKTSRITGRSVSAETVRNVIRHAGYSSRVARKKPFIRLQNQKKRLEFTKTHQLKTDNFWKKVIFSDESKLNIFGSDGRRIVWRKPDTVLDPKNLRPTVKHGGGSVRQVQILNPADCLHKLPVDSTAMCTTAGLHSACAEQLL
ncbi:transposable element Tcb2 transposase [Trichonephila clavipes]|nr:transposable element Tcb2 transposase [Trichonephila clavipes]